MRNYIWYLLGGLLSIIIALLAIGYYSRVDLKDDLTTERIERDLQTKWVVIAPQGQLWGFSPDQKITTKIIQKKTIMSSDKDIDGMVVAVELSAVAQVPQGQETPKEQKTPINKSLHREVTVLELYGIAKLHYDFLGDKYYLSSVEGVNLIVRPR